MALLQWVDEQHKDCYVNLPFSADQDSDVEKHWRNN